MQPAGKLVRDKANGSATALFLCRMLATIDLHLSDPGFSVDRLACEVGIGRRQLERKTRALVGHSPSALIRRLRLERAAELLGAGSVKVSDVSKIVGFKSPAHFTRVFRQTFGMSPSEHIRRSATAK